MIRNPEGSKNKWTALSHSGNERNRLFMNIRGGEFIDISGVSGADQIHDARSFVIWDFNQDGYPDIAVANSNNPLLQILTNQTSGSSNRFLAFRLKGGNHTAKPNPGLSNMDAIGTSLIIDTGETRILRTLSAGEGFASQNSKTLVIGIGSVDRVKSVKIFWPSGKTQELGPIESNSLVTVDEAKRSSKSRPYRASE